MNSTIDTIKNLRDRQIATQAAKLAAAGLTVLLDDQPFDASSEARFDSQLDVKLGVGSQHQTAKGSAF